MQVVFDPIDVSQDWLIHVSTRRRVTRAEYTAFCAANRDLRIERSAEGELIVMPPAHSRSGNQNAGLTSQLYIWAIRNGAGVAFDSSAGFDLPDGSNRSPDASWILTSRIDSLRPEQRGEHWKFARTSSRSYVHRRTGSGNCRPRCTSISHVALDWAG